MREYSLLLGAGASVGAKGGNGRLLPTGAGLRDALISDFDVDTGEDETITLVQAYDHLHRNRPDQLTAYPRKWFRGCDPSWQHLLAEFNWHRIWTFNIDDVIEVAFKNEGRLIQSLAWNERFSEGESTSSQQIIHLHGLANRLIEGQVNDDVLVFSIREYARVVSNSRTWHKVFFDEFAGRPFLIIGAQLTEEFDLAEVLQGGSVAKDSTGYPSVVVVPRISPIRREQLESAGLLIIEMEGEHFIRDLLNHYREERSKLSEIYGASTPGLRRFMQQFIDMRTYSPHERNTQDFFGGYQPTWNTIQANDDAILSKTTQAAAEIVEASVDEQIYQRIVILTGDLGSGKSTGLLRIAKELIGAGTQPFYFRADEYIDVEATIEWLRAVPRTVLLIDDFADFSSTIHLLAERCRIEGVRMLMICADRAARLPLIKDRIDLKYVHPNRPYWYGKLTNSDIEIIINKLHSRGRLGKITQLPRQEQQRHFVEAANRRLFDAMADLEGSSGFKEKAQSAYRNLGTDGLRSLYAAACLCYDQSIPLPVGIGAGIAGLLPRDLTRIIEQECGGILVLTGSGIRPSHRITANIVVNALPRDTRIRISSELAKSLAPHIDQQAMRAGTREYRIVRHLMNHSTIIRIVGRQNEQEAREWYENLREYYDWNGRYWDQRALLESRFGEHETARSYAERSIQVHRHSFGFNTLGTVLLRMAINLGSDESLLLGIRNLEIARGFQDWGEREHPFVTFFTSLIRFAEAWGINAVPHRARTSWTQWLRDANSSTVFSYPQTHRQLEEWNREWLKFAAEG